MFYPEFSWIDVYTDLKVDKIPQNVLIKFFPEALCSLSSTLYLFYSLLSCLIFPAFVESEKKSDSSLFKKRRNLATHNKAEDKSQLLENARLPCCVLADQGLYIKALTSLMENKACSML